MMSKMILSGVAAAIMLYAPVAAEAYEQRQEEITKRMMEMIADLGGHDAVGKNSGKTMGCVHGGTKKVSIVRRGSTTTYRGDYRNCREDGSTRDGLHEIVFEGEQLVSSTVKRSVNGELFDAARQGDAAGVRKLIRAGADVNYTESMGRNDGSSVGGFTPLMLAALAGNLDTVKLLVSNGAWVNYLNSMAVNSLWVAANEGNLEIVKYLAKHGAYINNSNIEDVTPLMAAAMGGHGEVVKFLVGEGAKIDAVHKEGDTALMFAVARGHSDIARYLIDAGANVNIRNAFGVTALIIAAAEGNDEVAGKLLEKKADTTARTTNGLTALDVARARGMAGIIDLFEEDDNRTP